MTEPPLWTVNEAVQYFADAGVPVEAWRIRDWIHGISLRPAGETRSGPRGGRGEARYDAGMIQRLHAKNYPLIVRDDSGV